MVSVGEPDAELTEAVSMNASTSKSKEAGPRGHLDMRPIQHLFHLLPEKERLRRLNSDGTDLVQDHPDSSGYG